MIVLVISCTFDLYRKLYYEIELVSYELYPIKLFKKKTKNQKHGGKCKQFFNILCITAQRYACHCKYDLHYTTLSLSIQTKVITQENILSCNLTKIQEKV